MRKETGMRRGGSRIPRKKIGSQEEEGVKPVDDLAKEKGPVLEKTN